MLYNIFSALRGVSFKILQNTQEASQAHTRILNLQTLRYPMRSSANLNVATENLGT